MILEVFGKIKMKNSYLDFFDFSFLISTIISFVLVSKSIFIESPSFTFFSELFLLLMGPQYVFGWLYLKVLRRIFSSYPFSATKTLAFFGQINFKTHRIYSIEEFVEFYINNF